MKRLTQIFQVLLGIVVLIFTAIIAFGRLTWRTIRNWWKKRTKWLRCSIVAVFILVPVGIVTLVACALYEDEYGRDYWDRKLSDNITLHSFSDNKWRVYDKQKGEYTTDKINWLSEVTDNDSLAVYALPNKRGYINVNTGRIVIDAEANEYRKAWVFSEGLAAVIKDGKIGFVNEKNEEVIPFKYECPKDEEKYKYSYLFHNGYCIMTNADGKVGLIDKAGNWVLEPVYDEIYSPYSEGYREIVHDGKFGILDSCCTIVYPAEYKCINIISSGFVLTKDGKQWQVDFDGNIVKSFTYESTYYLKYPIGYNECGEIQYAFADYVKYEVSGCFGIMNRITGEAITSAIYSDICMLSKDLFEVCLKDSYNYFLLDTQGNVVTEQ